MQCIGNRAPSCRTVLQNGQDKTPKASPKKRSIMEHSPGLPEDTKSSISCSGNQAKLHLKCHLGIKCHSQNNKVIRLLQYGPPIVNGGDWGCIVRDLETIIVLVLIVFNFIRYRAQHLLTLPWLWLRYSANVTLRPWNGATAIKVESTA